MFRHKLDAEALAVESFETLINDDRETRGTVPVDRGCICFAPPCICSAGPDCTANNG